MGLLRSAAKTIIGFDILVFLLLMFSMIMLEPESGSYVTAQLTLIPIVFTFVAAVIVLWTEWEPF